MFTLNTLAVENPDLTGLEIISLQKQIQEDEEFREKYKKSASLRAEILEGLYVKARINRFRYVFTKVTKPHISGNALYADLETISVMIGSNMAGDMNITRNTSTGANVRHVWKSGYDKTTKEDWDRINSYINAVVNFWKD